VAFYQGLGGDDKVYSFPLIVAVLFYLFYIPFSLPDSLHATDHILNPVLVHSCALDFRFDLFPYTFLRNDFSHLSSHLLLLKVQLFYIFMFLISDPSIIATHIPFFNNEQYIVLCMVFPINPALALMGAYPYMRNSNPCIVYPYGFYLKFLWAVGSATQSPASLRLKSMMPKFTITKWKPISNL